MISKKYSKKMEAFYKKMAEAKKYLPPYWVRDILEKKKLSVKKHTKLKNMMVNWNAGRSYRSSRKHGSLVREIVELSNKYKNLEL